MTQQFFNIATLVGTFLSLLGVLFAIGQIRRAVTAARAAENAAAGTERAIARNFFLADVSSCANAIEELKVLIRSDRHEAALLRVTDLTSNLIRIQHLPNTPVDTSGIEFRQILTQLVILRDVLEQKLHTTETDVNPVQANAVLSIVSDQLNHWIGGATFDHSSGDRRV